MSAQSPFVDTSALLRLRVTAEADLGALSRVLERFQNLNVVPRTAITPGYVTNTARGYLNDSRQFFVKVSYLFRF